MLNEWGVLAAAIVWLGLLFGAAVWGERHPEALSKHWGAVFALSLAVYCTSWTFFGTVQQARDSGWALPPTFLGTILLYALAFPVLLKLFRTRASSTARPWPTSSPRASAAARRSRPPSRPSPSWAGSLPGAAAESGGDEPRPGDARHRPRRSAGAGQRALRRDRAGRLRHAVRHAPRLGHRAQPRPRAGDGGRVPAEAGGNARPWPLAVAASRWLARRALPTVAGGTDGFPALVLLGALAMFTLPHQFHVGVVEGREEKHLRTARWLFPLYLVLIALPVLPLAMAGEATFGALGVPADLYVLALPMADGSPGMALLGFLGGLSAATGMLILATLTLSVMIGNHWLTPLRLRGGWRAGEGDLRGAVVRQRRFGIAAVLALAWAYSRVLGDNEALADIGALSFSGLATLAPAVGFALWRPQTPAWAVLVGLVAGFVTWAWVLLPGVAVALGADTSGLAQTPFGLAMLAPDACSGWSPGARSVAASSPACWSARCCRCCSPRGAAMRAAASPARSMPPPCDVSPHASSRLTGSMPPWPMRRRRACCPPPRSPAWSANWPRWWVPSSARLLLDALRQPSGPAPEQVAELVDEATQGLRFNQQLLEVALQHMSQGISVVDRDLRLVVWNRRYREIFGYPEALLQVGLPVAKLVEFNLRRGLAGDLDVSRALEQRLDHMRAGTPYLSERRIGDAVIEIRGEPMPGGGFVATFTDVTVFRASEEALRRDAETLEARVVERTRELLDAKAEADRANQAKTRFLAAVSHDLTQPLHAARLFTDALAQRAGEAALGPQIAQVAGALESAEELLAGLLDISRLDAGGLRAQPVDLPLQPLLEALARDAGVLAEAKGLRLSIVPTAAWVRTDPQLLRRVLQNFLANAVRYTARGGIVLGVRRAGRDALAIEVWDSGPGIAADQQTLVFEEFRRLQRGGQGLGLGLAIADRLARLLEAPLALRSRPGRGSVFSITVPRIAARAPEVPAPALPASAATPLGLRVLVVDNEPTVLEASCLLLHSWGAEVRAAATPDEAIALVASFQPQAWLLDFHLDEGETGDALHLALAARHPRGAGFIVTADHSETVRQAVLAVGATALTKPLKPLRLKTLLQQVARG